MSRSWGNEFEVATTIPPVTTHHTAIRAAIQSFPEPKQEGTATLGLSTIARAIWAWIVHGSSSRISRMNSTGLPS
jgi:hypothetical protein